MSAKTSVTENRRNSSASEQPDPSELAFQDLLELERCGVQVNWPQAETQRTLGYSDARASAGSPSFGLQLGKCPQAETQRTKGYSDTRASARGASSGLQPGESSERQQEDNSPESQSEELASAMEELGDLFRSGLAVRWPG